MTCGVQERMKMMSEMGVGARPRYAVSNAYFAQVEPSLATALNIFHVSMSHHRDFVLLVVTLISEKTIWGHNCDTGNDEGFLIYE